MHSASGTLILVILGLLKIFPHWKTCLRFSNAICQAHIFELRRRPIVFGEHARGPVSMTIRSFI
jgi:hypothetical protein